MGLGVGNKKKALEKLAEMRKEQKRKKMGTPKFAPGKGGGSDAARKGKGTVGKKKKEFKRKLPQGGKRPSFPGEEKFKMLKGERGKMAKGGRPGLYANIHAKRKSGRPMRKKGAAGAPTAANFRRAAQTVRKK